MEDDYSTTVLAGYTFVVGSSSVESPLLDLYMDTEIVDVGESAHHDGMNGGLEKEVVLDSDDEGGGHDKPLHQRNEEYVPVTGRFSGRGVIRLLKHRRSAGLFRRQGNNIREHAPRYLDSAESAMRSFLCNDEFGERHEVTDSVRSNAPDKKSLSINKDEFHLEAGMNIARESLPGNVLEKSKLLSHESDYINMEHESNYTPEISETHEKVLEFVDHYLSVTNLSFDKEYESRKGNRIKSPPTLWSKGSQRLASRINRGSADCNLIAYDWGTEEIEKNEYTSTRMNKDSLVHLSSYHENLEKAMVSGLQSFEDFSGNLSGANDLDEKSLKSKVRDKMGSYSTICVENDHVGSNDPLETGFSNLRCEQLGLTPDSLDIGLDTQIAAEAMEALLHATPILDPSFGQQSYCNKSSDVAYKESKSNKVVYPEEAFLGWRCKCKRSRCVKIAPSWFRNQCFSASNQSEVRRGIAARLPPSKKMRTENLRIMKDLNGGKSEDRMDGKCRGPYDVTLKQEVNGFQGRDILKDVQKHNSIHIRKPKKAVDVINLESPNEPREIIHLHDAAHRRASKGDCLNLNSGFGLKADSENRDDNGNREVADKTLSKLNLWSYPKQERTHKAAPCHSIRSSNQCSPSVAVENSVGKRCIGIMGAQKRVGGLLVYTRRRKSFSDSWSPSLNGNSFCDTPKPSNHCDKSKDNMKSHKWSNEHSVALQDLEGGDNVDRSCNYLSKSPLMKELARLGYAESLPDFLPKDSRRRRAMNKVCILFSQNLKPSILKKQKKIVAKLGLRITSCCADATHFVTGGFVRTRNLLEAIALGKPVVTRLWLENCEQAGYVVDEKAYILRDEKKEKEIGFNMCVSLDHARLWPLLKGRTVMMTPNVKPSLDVITGLVKAVRGQVVLSMPKAKTEDKAVPEDLLILSCEEDYKICLPFIERGASIYDSELLLNGIVTQKLEYGRYELFKDFMADSSSALLRKRKCNMASANHHCLPCQTQTIA